VVSLLVFRLWFYNSFGFRSERSDEGRSGGAGPAILGSPRWASTPAATIRARLLCRAIFKRMTSKRTIYKPKMRTMIGL
jgi:hypothetical protein